MINAYAGIAPRSDLLLLQRLGQRLEGRSFLHINSTSKGGGVAEILHRMLPILRSLGVRTRWEVLEGDDPFFDMTKKLHNALQGSAETFTEAMWEHHREINERNAAALDLEADAVLIHDPQPMPLVEHRGGGKWIWRCHIDLANPHPGVFERLAGYAARYDAAVFSVSKFARHMPMPEFIITPSIDPLSEKNIPLPDEEVRAVLERLGIPPDRPMILQVSRFDRFKDPIGVIGAFRMVRRYNDCCLVLAGSPATDDPEGAAVLEEVQEAAAGDPDIHIRLLPPFSDREINALQRAAAVVLQKSLKEGFGLTVAEALWKGKPVIGGAVGGIPLQIVHGATGYLVHSVEGTAFRIRQLLNDPEAARRVGEAGREFVRRHFLITRQARDYLAIWHSLEHPGEAILEV